METCWLTARTLNIARIKEPRLVYNYMTQLWRICVRSIRWTGFCNRFATDECLCLGAPGDISEMNVMSPSPEDSYRVSKASHIFRMAETKVGFVPLFAIQVSMASTRDLLSPEKHIDIAELCAIARSLHACPCTASLTLSSRGIKSSTANATSLGSSVSILLHLY